MTWDASTFTLIIPFEGNVNVPTTGTYVSKAVTVFVESGFTNVASNCFYSYTSLKFLTLPDSVVSLGNNFLIGTKIITINIPLKLSVIAEDQPFDNQWTLERFIVDEKHEYFTTFDDSLYSKDMKTLFYYPGGKKDKTFFIPNGVEIIFNAALAFSTSLEEIVIPPSVTSINKVLGYYLSALKKVTIINCGSNITMNKNYMFTETNYAYNDIEWKKQDFLYSLTNGSSHLSIFANEKCSNSSLQFTYNDTKFMGNSYIKSITFERGISNIKGDCFKGCSKLTKISFPDTLSSIDRSSFSNCASLKKYGCIFYPNNILHLLRKVFSPYVLGLTKNTCIVNRNSNVLIYFFIVALS